MTDPNRHPADRLADIRAEIAVLREEEENLRQGFISGALPLYGDEFTVNVERKENLRIDGAALRKHVDEVVWRPFAITATSDYVTVRKRVAESKPRATSRQSGPTGRA
jgi:hypothetical protein